MFCQIYIQLQKMQTISSPNLMNEYQSKKSSSHLKKLHCLNGRKLVLINNGVWNIYNLQQGHWGKTRLLSNCFSKMINDTKISVTATRVVLGVIRKNKTAPLTHQWKKNISWKKFFNFQSFWTLCNTLWLFLALFLWCWQSDLQVTSILVGQKKKQNEMVTA